MLKMHNKSTRRFCIISIGIFALMLAGCSNAPAVSETSTNETNEEIVNEYAANSDNLISESDVETASDDVVPSVETGIPAYEYPESELFYSALYGYMTDELSGDYPDCQVSIPCPVIIAEDDSDKSDIRVYGNFWIFNYDLNGEILECTSGGSYPGCIHIKDTDEGYTVTAMDVVEDGSRFTDSAKEIFGEYYDTFMTDGEDENIREEIRTQIIVDYVKANKLNITAYKDYGWDPVTLPE